MGQLLAEADKLRHALAALDPRERSTTPHARANAHRVGRHQGQGAQRAFKQRCALIAGEVANATGLTARPSARHSPSSPTAARSQKPNEATGCHSPRTHPTWDKARRPPPTSSAGFRSAVPHGPNPRLMNRYIRNAEALSTGYVNVTVAQEAVIDLNSTTLDGYDLDMQRILKFILRHGRREKSDGTVVYQASVNSIATALGKSRDTKAVSLYTEPYLIETRASHSPSSWS